MIIGPCVLICSCPWQICCVVDKYTHIARSQTRGCSFIATVVYRFGVIFFQYLTAIHLPSKIGQVYLRIYLGLPFVSHAVHSKIDSIVSWGWLQSFQRGCNQLHLDRRLHLWHLVQRRDLHVSSAIASSNGPQYGSELCVNQAGPIRMQPPRERAYLVWLVECMSAGLCKKCYFMISIF